MSRHIVLNRYILQNMCCSTASERYLEHSLANLSSIWNRFHQFYHHRPKNNGRHLRIHQPRQCHYCIKLQSNLYQEHLLFRDLVTYHLTSKWYWILTYLFLGLANCALDYIYPNSLAQFILPWVYHHFQWQEVGWMREQVYHWCLCRNSMWFQGLLKLLEVYKQIITKLRRMRSLVRKRH